MYEETTAKLLDFIKKSPTAFQAAGELRKRFLEEGYQELKEEEHWELQHGGKYFVMRNHSAIIAFSIPVNDSRRFHIIASHSDSPSFKIKENPEIPVNNAYVKLNVEAYGGMIMSTWFDRPLSVAGRMIVRKNGKIVEKMVCIDRDLLMIPSLAIHMNREVNGGYRFNVQKDLLPLYGNGGDKGTFMLMMAKEAGVRTEDILGHDLFLYNRMPGTVWGARNEFVSSPRLDDLQCAFSCLKGFLAGKKTAHSAVYCVFDNEEVGSLTRQGAASTFLKDTLERICECLSMSRQNYLMAIAGSLMVSADNAHAAHPAHPEKSDPVNRPYMNEGIVIKYNAAQNYCTDGFSGAVFKDICRRADVPYQIFSNRSDRKGGSTLGNLSSAQVPVSTVDLGLPQLAMHAPYEMAGSKDTLYLVRAMETFYK